MIIIFLVSFLIVIIGLLISLSSLISIFFGAFAIASNKKVVRKALELANLKLGDHFIDLGCGVGTVLKIARDDFGARVTGYEIAPLPYLISKFRFKSVYCKPIKRADLTKSDIIFTYLSDNLMRKNQIIFKKALKNGSTIVSVSFPIPDIKPKQQVRYLNYTIYIY